MIKTVKVTEENVDQIAKRTGRTLIALRKNMASFQAAGQTYVIHLVEPD